jgi:hypothetical protein
MAQKPNRPIKPMPVQRPLTEQEKQARIMQFLQQKREQFTLTILNGLCSNPKTLEERVVVSSRGGQHTDISNAEKVVNLAVDMADKLLEKLYPIKEEESK